VIELIKEIIFWYLTGGLVSVALIYFLMSMRGLNPAEFGLTKTKSLFFAFISSWVAAAVFSTAFLIGFFKTLFCIEDDEDKKENK